MEPGWRWVRVVRAMVSAARSAEKRGGKALGSMQRAVRQTPLTAMLSPVLRRLVSVGEAMVMRVAPVGGSDGEDGAGGFDQAGEHKDSSSGSGSQGLGQGSCT